MEIKDETLQAIRQKLAVCTFVSEELINVETFKVDGVAEWVVRTTFEEFVAMHPKAYSHPADWWQAFKQRFFPAFMLRRWPVAMTEVDVWATVQKGGGIVPFFKQRSEVVDDESE